MGKKPVKPTGEVPFLTFHGDGRPAEVGIARFPADKEEVERLAANLFVRVAAERGWLPFNLVRPLVQNPPPDLDFTLWTGAGKEYLELMETAPLERFGQSYSNAPYSFYDGTLADAISSLIDRKNKKYSSPDPPVIHLLLYSTDVRFFLSDNVLHLLAYWSARTRHVFRSVSYLCQFRPGDGVANLIFPRPDMDFDTVPVQELRKGLSVMVPANRGEFTQDGQGWSAPLLPEPSPIDEPG